MPKTLFTYNPTLMSARTAKYVEATIREGDNFDYDEWLKWVRREEAEAKQLAGFSGVEAAAMIDEPITTLDGQTRPNPALRLLTKTIRLPRVLSGPYRQAKSPTPKAQLGRWLEKVRRAWDEFQSSRARDAVYQFLSVVFDLVMHYKVRRRTKRLLRHAFEFANLPFDKNAHPFSAVIHCTCGNAVDNKMISKWGRALRYASRRKEPGMRLKTFMTEAGGVNACANLYAKHFGRGRRK
jgi:hypothetical protein